MAGLRFGSCGPEVAARQARLIRLGLLAAEPQGLFDAATAQAVRDGQRRLLLPPDGVIDGRTAAALDAATSSSDSGPISAWRRCWLQGQELASRGEASDDHLPLLDQGLAASPLGLDPTAFPRLLTLRAVPTRDGAQPRAPQSPSSPAYRPYPPLGRVPLIEEEGPNPGGLSFLSDAVSQACLCVATPETEPGPLRFRWFGRRALEDNVQFWSATKWIAPLHLAGQAARRRPDRSLADALVRPAAGGPGRPFPELFEQMVSYGGDASTPGCSNAIGYLFKQLLNPGEPDLQSWLRAISGNPRLQFLGRYGCDPLIAGAELVSPAGELLVAHGSRPRSRNLVSAYDLVRLLTLLAWHPLLDQDQRLPWLHWGHLAPLVQGLGHDTARYIDHALTELGLREWIDEPVVLSKMGFGAETGDPAIDALTYTALFSGLDRCGAVPVRRRFAMALRCPTCPGEGISADARMASEVIEIVRRLFSGTLG